VEEQSNLDRIY